MSSSRDQEISEFKTEAMDLLDVAEKSLLALDSGGDFKLHYDSIFRTFHNLKGAAGMMELGELQSHMHELENILVNSKESAVLKKELIDFFLRGVDATKQLLENKTIVFDYEVPISEPPIDSAVTSPDTPVIANAPHKPSTSTPSFVLSESSMGEFLAECDEISERLSKNFLQLEQKTNSQETIDTIYRDFHSLKGSAQLFGFSQLGELAHLMESCLDPLRKKKVQLSNFLVDVLLKCIDLVDRMIKSIREKEPLNFKTQIHALTEALEKMISDPQGDDSPMPENIVPQETTTPTTPGVDHDKESATTIRVPVPLLDRLMTLMGEMVLVRNQVLQYSSQSDDLEFLNLSQRLNVVTSEIQGEMMKTRMQPIGNVMSKFTRMVRDLAKELGKKIEFTLTGAETELDKTLLEAVKDPLTHIIRNSCDHGIESPQERKRLGKPEIGSIAVRAYHEGGQVIIETRDDGKGLHRNKLLSKALEKGLVTHDKAASMSDRDVMDFIFAPGFSTAAQITNVSGRGVGMDVVRSNIEKIGGVVELNSQHGKGATICLKIPLTLAIVPAMIVRCDNDRYAIPQVKLVELVRAEQNGNGPKIEYLQGKPVYRLRGNLLPLIDLKEILRFPKTDQQNSEVVNIVVLNAEEQYFGIIVDEIQDTADIVVKPLNRFLKSLTTYSGATVLGDGSVAVILDVIGIAHQQQLITEKKDQLLKATNSREGQLKNQNTQEFLLFKLNSPTKHAILLSYVHRLEEFKREQIEYSGQQRVVRYRNSVLPIISMNDFLNFKPKIDISENEIISVIVTQRGDSVYGLEVNEILDVLSTENVMETGLADYGVGGRQRSDERL